VLKPWLKEEWCIPTISPEFVWHMEDVLDLYGEPATPDRPRVCFDECPYQLIGDVRMPLAPRPGQLERYDYEYRRAGTCNLFIFVQPETGWRHIEVTDRRTALDFAQCMKALVDVHFPDAAVIQVVLDQLNTHTPAALYQAFEPAEARRIVRKLEFHYTPKHGSWLNMAEIELSVLSHQCLDRRLPDSQAVRDEVAAWEAQRNEAQAAIHWRFTAQEARIKLKRLYPS
jgi:hypothetical protein